MPDCTGGQVFQSRGLEKQAGNAVVGLVREQMGCPFVWQPKPCPNMEGYLEGHRGTPNHRLLLRTWDYGWEASRGGNNPDRDRAEHWLADFFERQDSMDGWMYGEPLTTNHGQLWDVGVYGARYLAGKHGSKRICDAVDRHLRQAKYMYMALDIDGHVLGPSCRCGPYGKKDEEVALSMATLNLRTVEYALMRGVDPPNQLLHPDIPLPGRPNNPDSPWWRDVYNVGVWIARRMRAEGYNFGGGPEQPILRDAMRIERKGNEMIASYAHITKAQDVCFWAGRRSGKFVSAPFHGGRVENKDNPYPPPPIPGATVLEIPGLN
jgi:hypothetical protein